jgi:hypothetical protein
VECAIQTWKESLGGCGPLLISLSKSIIDDVVEGLSSVSLLTAP